MLTGVKYSQSDLEKHHKTFCGLYVLLQGVVDACLQIPLCRKGLCTVLLLCAGGCFLSLQRHAADAGACHAERYQCQSFYVYHIA